MPVLVLVLILISVLKPLIFLNGQNTHSSWEPIQKACMRNLLTLLLSVARIGLSASQNWNMLTSRIAMSKSRPVWVPPPSISETWFFRIHLPSRFSYQQAIYVVHSSKRIHSCLPKFVSVSLKRRWCFTNIIVKVCHYNPQLFLGEW